MKFGDNFFADSEINANGTSLRGYVQTTREKLTEVFGDPQFFSMGDKVTTQWIIQFDSGEIATIYDWKRFDQEVFSVTTWNIGGMDTQAADLVRDYVNYVNDKMKDYVEAKSRVRQTA